jgi:hypothetical protein
LILAEDAPQTSLWKQIQEAQVSVEEIEELYGDFRATPLGDSGFVKATTLKRTFFSSEEN